MAEKPKVTSAGSINVSKQFAANTKTASAAAKSTATSYKTPAVIAKPTTVSRSTTTSGGYSGIPATKTVTTGGYSGIPASTKTITTGKASTTGGKSTGGTQPKVGKETGSTNTFIPGYTPGGTDTGTGGSTEDTGFPAAGTFAGWEYSADKKQRRARYHDGRGGFYFGAFEANPDYQEEEKKKVSNIAYDTIEKILESYRITGLASVLEAIRDEYPEASSDDIITLLQFDDRYNAKFNERFAANVKRQKAGKPVLSPGEYLQLEQAYEKVFNSYNLPSFKSQSYYDNFILSDVDPTEVTDRVQLAYDRVLNDDPVTRAFKQFYSSLGFSDIVSGMLDPVNQLPALQQKVKAAEIGGAALRQGLAASEMATTPVTSMGFANVTTGTLGADVLGRQGLTKEEAESGYSAIAQILPTAEKLSSIYGGREDQYGRLEAEQERFQGLASAQRKRLQLTGLETAQFKKSSGLGKGALSSQLNV